MLGLCGAQRVGKSTLAEAFARAQGITFVQTSASGVFAQMGLDPKRDYPLEIRYAVQEMILATFEAQYAEAARRGRLFVADRTPIDLASYMLADVQRETFAGKRKMSEAVNDYVLRCLHAASRHFSLIVLVQPGIKTVEAEGKAPACPSYMEHINLLQLGLLGDSRNIVPAVKLPRTMTDLNERLFALHSSLQTHIEAQKERRESLLMH